jgi:Glycosyltransferase family 87
VAGAPEEPRTTGGRPKARITSLLPPLPIAVAAVVLTPVALLRVRVYLVDFWQGRSGGDFAEYYVAALIGRAHGWPAVYDIGLYRSALRSLTGNLDVFVNLPLAAWVALPFTLLPFPAADRVWQSALLVLFIATWRASTTGSEWVRAALLLAALASFPVFFAIHLGQLVLAVAALLVLHWRLLRAGHPVLAGIALGLAFVKPQDVFLVPVALLLSGRWKAAASCAATVAVLGGGVLLALGPQGIHAYQSSLAYEMAREFYMRHTLPGHLPSGTALAIIRPVILALALAPAILTGARRYERALAAAVLGGFLLTPYLNAEDLTLLFLCAWLLLGTETPAWMRLAMAVSYPVVAFENVLWAPLLLGVELVWLALLASEAITSAERGPWVPWKGRPAEPVPTGRERSARNANASSQTTSTLSGGNGPAGKATAR